MKRITRILLTILLVCCLFFQSCSFKLRITRPETTDAPVQTDEPTRETTESKAVTEAASDPEMSPESTAAAEPEDSALIRYQNAGNRDYLDDVPVEMVNFEDMVYTHPDVEAMYAEFDALTAEEIGRAHV